MSPPRFTETLTINPPLLPTAELCFARAPNLGNKENRDYGLGLKTWPS